MRASDTRAMSLTPRSSSFALLVAVLPYVAATAQRIASLVASQHRTCGDEKGRQVHGDRTHKQSRCGLVATTHQHRTVDRVGAQEFLGLHGEEVPVQHRRGFLERLGER